MKIFKTRSICTNPEDPWDKRNYESVTEPLTLADAVGKPLEIGDSVVWIAGRGHDTYLRAGTLKKVEHTVRGDTHYTSLICCSEDGKKDAKLERGLYGKVENGTLYWYQVAKV